MKTLQLVKSTSTVAGMTFLSRILGFLRDMIIAQLFGATAGVDAFLVAFKIPNFMRRLFAEGAFSQAFIPILMELRRNQTPEVVNLFIARIVGLLSGILFLVTLLAVIFAPFIVMIFAPGFSEDPNRLQLTSTMLRITIPYLLLISLTALAGALLNSQGYFAVPAFTPVLLNLAIISAALVLRDFFTQPIIALAAGVLLGGIVQLIFQIPFLFKTRQLLGWQWNWQDNNVRRVLKLMGPAVLGVSAAQINMLVNVFFASFLAVGSVSWLYYADRLTAFPLGIFGVAIATVILPTLSNYQAEQSSEKFLQTLRWGLQCVLLIGLPATIGLFLLAGPLLVTLFHYGHFTTHDVLMTRECLWAFALAVPAFMLIKVLATGFYSQQDIKTPVMISIISLLCNIGLNLILIAPLRHAGLAIASSVSAWINVGLLMTILIYKKQYPIFRAWNLFWLRLLIANAVMAIVVYIFTQDVTVWLHWSWLMRTTHLFCIVTLGMLCYGATLLITGMKFKTLLCN